MTLLMADHLMWKAYKRCGVNVLVPWWLMASMAYEIESAPILTDRAFDEISIILSNNWDTVEHQHKYLIDGNQVAFTGSAVTTHWDNMPDRIKQAIKAVRWELIPATRRKPKRRAKPKPKPTVVVVEEDDSWLDGPTDDDDSWLD